MTRTAAQWMGVIGFILCAVWLSFTVSFFAMITSAGEANMELEIGPFVALEGQSAILFTRGLIGFGLVMLVFFFWRRRIGFILAIVWSLWWGAVLTTALFSASSLSERIEIFIIVLLFLASLWFALARVKGMRPEVSNQS